MPIEVHRSNRVEVLADALGASVGARVRSPFEVETIVVQSKGMERWLSMYLAQRFGVWANAEFPFPRAFMLRLSELLERGTVPTIGGTRPGPRGQIEFLSRAVLGWSIAAILPELFLQPKFAELKRYAQEREGAVRRLELADKIAQVFDRYSVYRPELLRAFAAGEADDWQAELWRRLLVGQGAGETPTHVGDLVHKLERARQLPVGLPARIHVFGISSLPPVYLDVLNALSRHCPVHVFQLSPSREYFGQVRSARELAKLEDLTSDWDAQHLAVESPLLAALGRLGRDFQQLLESRVEYVEANTDLYVEPGASTALAVLQSDILNLTPRGVGKEKSAPAQLNRADTSVTVHSCHGPIREIEVLRDQLLARFEADLALEPHDVIVMMPDVEAYAPIIDAVFGLDPAAHGYIPYRIADRSLRAGSASAEAFMALLRVLGGRLKASEVLDLLGLLPIQTRFGLSGADLSQIQHWVFRSGIRWGANAAQRAEMNQPSVNENTWTFGLQRLLLGWTLPTEGERMFEGVLPVDSVEGSQAEALGQLAAFFSTLFQFLEDFKRAKTPRVWQERLLALLAAMLGGDSALEADLEFVRQTIGKVVGLAELGNFREQLDLRTLETVLVRAFKEESTHHDFMSGGVTFCALLPMRSIPFRIVCLVGMNDGDFPRTTPRIAFDRMAQNPRLGDRSLTDEDRYLFLEALLAARDALIVTYVGRDPQDNTERPPSVVVGELLDVVEESFCLELESRAGEAPMSTSSHFHVEHPLQAFSPRYFDPNGDTRLFSFSEVEAGGAAALFGKSRGLPPFQGHLLPEIHEPNITLDQLATFFENPARAFLQDRFGISLRDEPELVADREPITPDALERYAIGNEVLEQLFEGMSLQAALVLARAMGSLPLGTPGSCVYQGLAEEAEQLAQVASGWLEGERLPPRRFRVALTARELHGAFSELWPKGQVRRKFVRVTAKREVSFWVRHLALQCASPGQLPQRSILIGRASESKSTAPEVCIFRPVEAGRARVLLQDLVDLYRLGHQLPLRFFPKAAQAFVQNELKHAESEYAFERALSQANDAFIKGNQGAGGNFLNSESEDLYVACCFRGEEPISAAPVRLHGGIEVPGFVELSQRIYAPLLEYRDRSVE